MFHWKKKRQTALEALIASSTQASIIAYPSFITFIQKIVKKQTTLPQTKGSTSTLASNRSKSVSLLNAESEVSLPQLENRNISPRRSCSAPVSAQSIQTLLENEMFHVASVKAKVDRKLASQEFDNHENWDLDFVDEEIIVPRIVCNVQNLIQKDGLNMRKFAWHVEDLKLLYLELLDMEQGLHDDSKRALRAQYQSDLDHSRVLVNLAEEVEGKNGIERGEDDLQILATILGRTLSNPSDELEFDDEDWDKDILDDSDSRMVLGVDDLPKLVDQIAPLKQRISNYMKQVREQLIL